MLTEKQIQFYNVLENNLSDINFVNKTPDSLIEILFPQSKAHLGLPFYSDDFLNRINFKQNLSVNYDYYLTLDSLNDKKHCTNLGQYPQGISFFEKSSVHLCRF